MTRTDAEADQLAVNIVNKLLGNLMFDFPAVGKAIGKLNKKGWADWLQENQDELGETLKKYFATGG